MDKNLSISLVDINKTFDIKNSSFTIRERVKNLFSRKQNRANTLKALSDINLDVKKNETLGIIGRNGSGKSTLLNIIMNTYKPDKGGSVLTNGRIIRLDLGMGVDPNLSARDNIYVNGSVLGLTFKKIGSIFDEIITFASLEDFIDTPVKFFSKGMRQRLLFSIAIHAEADIFILDEFFGGTGDLEFRKKSDRVFKENILNKHTVVIVSHSLKIITEYCNRVIWLEKGKCVTIGPPQQVTKKYKAFVQKRKLENKSGSKLDI